MCRTQEKTRGLSVRTSSEEQLLMVHYPGHGSTAVLRTVDEFQSPGEIWYIIPYGECCGFTLFQGWLTFLG